MDNIINIDEKKKPRAASAGSGGGGSMDLEKRVGNLEADMKDVKKSLQGIEVTLARIEGELKTKASAVELAEIKGKLTQMPSTWTMLMAIFASNLTIVGVILAVIRFGLK
jgi:hypothetical protein